MVDIAGSSSSVAVPARPAGETAGYRRAPDDARCACLLAVVLELDRVAVRARGQGVDALAAFVGEEVDGRRRTPGTPDAEDGLVAAALIALGRDALVVPELLDEHLTRLESSALSIASGSPADPMLVKVSSRTSCRSVCLTWIHVSTACEHLLGRDL
ncbi:hypothetical protein [Frigoribacterium sp. Leaf172]|uniref:hypothetical protein n=1 Tax=Frigoribacterium sp. Leaf172 TaxID=1736285 RepID=UPI0012E8928C|nr:hypothetical protein [Frigoribacterium sp. Leaf172]